MVKVGNLMDQLVSVTGKIQEDLATMDDTNNSRDDIGAWASRYFHHHVTNAPHNESVAI